MIPSDFSPVLVVSLLVILVTAILIYGYHLCQKNDSSVLFRNKNILFVTAHPDDECMFFSPSIVSLKRYCRVHLLCLTNGDFYRQGEVRKQELIASCNILGILSSHVTVVNHKDLRDDPCLPWDIKEAGRAITDHVKYWNIGVVVTFDFYGVSGHRNHIDTYKATKRIKDQGLINNVTVYTLESVNIVRKYVSFLDLPFSLLSRKLLILSSFQDITLAQKAMCAHASQLVWFRKLYILFSRFMVINTLEEIH